MTPQIIEKLKQELRSGLRSESQVVYLLVGIRKILEQEGTASKFKYLKFHCDWALHSKLEGTFAQRILKLFDSAHGDLLKDHDLPQNDEVTRISKMNPFREETSTFLSANGIEDFTRHPNHWPRFMYLYSRIIEDCPLVIRADSTSNVEEVVISVELANKLEHGHRFFKVSWNVRDRMGNSGSLCVLNSYAAEQA